MKRFKMLLLSSFLGLVTSAHATVWEQIRTPVAGQAQPIGGYSNGCIIGAQPLALKGDGYQVIRSARNRFYGHPDLLSFLQRLAKNTKAAGLPPILIGDMGMPAGGRFSSGHASHQTGLDADIWFRFGPMDEQTAKNPAGLATLMVNRDAQVVDESVWTSQHAMMVKLAAQDARVDRIFVNPAVKVKLCNTAGSDRIWLRKVRPWYGHDSHMHVRLSCPQNAPNCENQAPIPVGDGCGAELYSWFEPAPAGSTVSKPKVLPTPPVQCQMILSSQGLN
ncbi:penicillin-insensitive murein endopeptidase [Actinobacillus pleuropneumoniae]|uniref:Penicillin-insensitive murein endopeptidase n=1 Tax=Actinobacillus pleuropneumoniae TaxID=715 RepID=A0ABM6X203_ACTPL|nr:penicillin-insensitive murein endopeptidase [Actinobacillus pleuropneumoniae]ASU16716.1 Penicillin-insensitive murein endopeptidase [Actinobacillus pleuropneumoniae]AWG95155.1 penicillin-insensitive murein endopeptidase [Actinobacillus pleuropneumoniae serovar 1 str. 4074]AXA21226.1 penicillin-insensitive murein endopeptidase [Actinobacillus pleuropneumoniae]MBL4535652.1 penicillin-insensitive murein endopeptidase [Actinobacillus pleuropneumoniae]MCI1068514.1 penicillin-insensitive murein e